MKQKYQPGSTKYIEALREKRNVAKIALEAKIAAEEAQEASEPETDTQEPETTEEEPVT